MKKLFPLKTETHKNACMKNKIKLCTATVALGLLTSLGAQAATIDWEAPVNVSGDGSADINKTGTLQYAYQYGTDSDALTIDGVTFANVADTATNTSFTSYETSGQQGHIGVVPETTGDYEILLSQNTYQAGKTGRNPWTLRNLTSGQKYLVQFWVADTRYPTTAFQTITGGDNKSADISVKTGQYVIGTFTADGPTQDVSFSNDILNAVQLRAIP
jgi:hypothetical protein